MMDSPNHAIMKQTIEQIDSFNQWILESLHFKVEYPKGIIRFIFHHPKWNSESEWSIDFTSKLTEFEHAR